MFPLAGWAEADAGIALFDYYREQALKKIDFLPFVHADADAPLRRLEIASSHSRYLQDGLRLSVFWMRVDRHEIDSALRIADDFLLRYPHNRLARQMRGSALYRGGHLNEARATFEDLLHEYAVLKTSSQGNVPLGYYSCIGNLVRIYVGLGMNNEAHSRFIEWQQARNSGLDPWLPPSLKKDLDHLKIP